MKKSIQDILKELETIRNTLESCINREVIDKNDYEQITDKLRSALVMVSTLKPAEPVLETDELEKKIIEKLIPVVDSLIERKLGELKIGSGKEIPAKEYNKTEVADKSEKTRDKKSDTESLNIRKDESYAVKKDEGSFMQEIAAEKNKPVKNLHEVLSKDNPNPEMAENIPGRKITDLEKAISLNEKFVFIKELFGGNAHQYSQAVTKLNSMTGYDEAMNFIQSDYSWWDKKDSTVKAFIDLIRRRYL